MSDPHNVEQFPALSNKLSAPKKESLYQRQKQEAEAKRLREAAENAAALETFVKSLEDGDGSQPLHPTGGRLPPMAPHGSARGGPNRHFVASAKKSGPGTLGPAPPLSRKRSFDGPVPPSRKHPKGPLGFDHGYAGDSDEEDDNLDAKIASSKPTIHMSSLPLGTSQAVIKSLLPDSLSVDAVRVLSPSGNNMDRKSQSAIVTFSASTPVAAIDAAVTALQNRYLGWGFYLSLSRGLSSAALNASTVASGSSHNSSLPFGAKSASSSASSFKHAPPPPSHLNGRFAPPTSYNSSAGPATCVQIVPPASLAEIRLIHKTVESLLTHGPEFEALLMTRLSVQRDEKWAWLWDPRSPGGVWYRWRIWELVTGSRYSGNAARSGEGKARLLFEGGAPWVEPAERTLPFEFTTNFEALVDDDDYNSSEEEDSGDEDGLPHHQQRNKKELYDDDHGPPDLSSTSMADEDNETTYLNPLHRAKLVHLLSRLPTTTAKLRVGDVARVTSFAITHAGSGAEETCELLALNVLQPLCLQSHLTAVMSEDEEGNQQKVSDGKVDEDDQSQPILVALRVVSDLLSASSASGIRHAWKYRQLIYSSLVKHGVFRHLGRMERDIAAQGRIRAEKWRRSVTQGVLGLWETWGVFLGGEMESFLQEFDAGSKEKHLQTEKKLLPDSQMSEDKEKKESRWRAVDDTEAATHHTATSMTPAETMQTLGDGPLSEDIDGQPMTDDELDGVPMGDTDEESRVGQTVVGADDKSQATAVSAKIPGKVGAEGGDSGSGDATMTRQRPRAVDMFNDSDEEATR